MSSSSSTAAHTGGEVPKLQLRDVHVTYRSADGKDVEAVKGIDLSIANKPEVGEIVVFLGPSGCGKSTLLKAVAGLLPLSRGEVLVDGVKVEGVGRERGMVFQAYTPLSDGSPSRRTSSMA